MLHVMRYELHDMSDPKEKDKMIKIVTNLLVGQGGDNIL